MHSAVVSLLLSLVTTVLLLQCGGRLRSGLLTREQQAIPIGGLAIMVGLCGGVLAIVAQSAAPTSLWWIGLSAMLPLFMVGGADDFWVTPSLFRRGAVTVVVTLVVCSQFEASLFWMMVAALFVTAVTHSVNAVDSRNGCAAMCSLLIHGALAYVAYSLGDTIVMQATLIVIGALLGVSFFSFQTDLARLGHSGCALVGFSTAGLSVCLMARHAEVSSLFALLLCSHSLIAAAGAYRRGGTAAFDRADNRVPSLLYHRIVRWATGNPPDRRRPERDSSVMPHLWMLSVASIAPALLWWKQTPALAAALAFRVFLQWAVSRLLDEPKEAPRTPQAVRPAVEFVTELPGDSAFFQTSAKRSTRAESGTA
jgi:UDP-GlcNAc:undecaprenyl-phosphate/decaprenyl-phosphate GlcNAc-1-phosphate transferase